MQGSENFGKPGKIGQSKTTCGIGGKFQITTRPPPPPGAHAVHQMTGTTVSVSSLLVVIHVLVVIPDDCMISVDTPGGTVVIVEVMLLIDVLSSDTEVLGTEPIGSVVWTGSEVVLPQTFNMPEDPRDTVQASVVKPGPPGVIVVDPMTIPEALPDAVRSGLMVICTSGCVVGSKVAVKVSANQQLSVWPVFPCC
jgi:hypothetical protein